MKNKETNEKKIVLKNDLSEIRKVREGIEDFGRINKFSEEDTFDANLALEEVVVNIISYAYKNNEIRSIEVDLKTNGDELVMKVEDDGKHFDPLLQDEPNCELPLDQREPGGWGIHLVRNIMDKLEYIRKDQKNIFIMHKRLTK
ncbi:MAG: ATP-binding protein [Candidatus Omnitrophota bacterium]